VHEAELCEFRPRVKTRRADIGVDFVERGKGGSVVCGEPVVLGRLQHEPHLLLERLVVFLELGQERQNHVHVAEVVDLEMAFDAVGRHLEFADADAGVGAEPVDPAQFPNLGFEFLGGARHVGEVVEVAGQPLHHVGCSLSFECGEGFLCDRLTGREEYDLFGVVRGEGGDDAEADSSGAAGDDIDFVCERGDVREVPFRGGAAGEGGEG